MHLLPNNCSCSAPTVSPKDWMTGGIKLLKVDWYIQYYFRDPSVEDLPKRGKFIIIKRMNKFKTLAERREATQFLLDNEVDLLLNFEYNPVKNTRIYPTAEVYEKGIDPDTPFTEALTLALGLLSVTRETKQDIRSIIKYITLAATRVGYSNLQVNEVTRKHIKILLDQQAHLKITSPKGELVTRSWTNARYNVYWKYLHRLFEELIECEACEYNPVARISKKSTVNKMRVTLTKEQRHEVVNVYLKEKYYNFYRFCQIFFHSGARIAELLRMKVKDVNLQQQKFKITVLKGKNSGEEERTIKNIALPFWIEQLKDADPEWYVFGKNETRSLTKYTLLAGKISIQPRQITDRWERLVKRRLGVVADIYSLKHSNLDDIAAKEGKQAAQSAAGHSSISTTEKYLPGEDEREHNRYRKIDNEL